MFVVILYGESVGSKYWKIPYDRYPPRPRQDWALRITPACLRDRPKQWPGERLTKYPSIRYREVAYPGDVGLSLLGFIVSFIVRTKLIEGCPSNAIVLKPEDTAAIVQYRILQKEKERLKEVGRKVEGIGESAAVPSFAGRIDPGMGGPVAIYHRILFREVKRENEEDTGEFQIEGYIESVRDGKAIVKTAAGLREIELDEIAKVLALYGK